MKNLFLSYLLLCFLVQFSFAQNHYLPPEFQLTRAETEAHLRFLAADELQGRRTGDLTNAIAARYIAEQLRSYGVKTAGDLSGYFQPVPFIKSYPAESGELSIGDLSFSSGANMIVMGGEAATLEAPAVFANYGWVDEESSYDDYKNLDVKGKVVFVLSGRPDTNNPYEIFQSMPLKSGLAAERGALGLVEIYKLNFPWGFFKRNFNRESLTIAKDPDNPLGELSPLPYFWINPEASGIVELLKNDKSQKLKLKSSGKRRTIVSSQNVVGVIEGSDPELKEEYVLLSAHYDHVGTGARGSGAVSEQDTIFNGARDNAMGVTAIIAAAKALAQDPPKRSVIILAVTAEEIGLLGSQFYADHPVIPLEQTVFNLNIDGAGYNDKSKVSVIGFDRVGAAAEMQKAARTFGFEVFADPAPEQNLFDRSDNVSFAKKGIPAPTFSPGVTGFDEEINKYYHQVTDNPDTIDFDYLQRFCQSFALAARLIANKKDQPRWKEGDKYEEAGNRLYNF